MLTTSEDLESRPAQGGQVLTPSITELDERPTKKHRHYEREQSVAMERTVERLAGIRASRDRGELGEEVIKLAQALILCTLPYRPTKERQFVRKARLSDGSTLIVTFTAGINGIDMPFGADRDLMAWLFDKAIASETPWVSIKNASEYLNETGRARNDDRVKELSQRLKRISGLVIGIERRAEKDSQTLMLPVVASSNLPHNLRAEMDAEDSGQGELPGIKEPFGIKLEERFFKDIKRHFVAIPRRLWLDLQGVKGGPALKDLLTFFIYRCYCAENESVIPWAGLREQFPQNDSNPGRLKENVKRALTQLKILWPEARVEVLKEGVWVNKAKVPFLPDDPAKKRVRRIEGKSSAP